MNELTDKHDVDDGLYIYLQRNSKVWLARFKIAGKWISRTTKQRDRAKASRYVVGHSTVLDMILDMHSRSLDGQDTEHGVPDDFNPLVFRLPDGSTTDQLGRNFTVLLKRLGLEQGPGGKRTLYSLRHTYITHLLLDKVPPSVIAKQCGTSTAMIELHYSHITPLMYAKELAGSDGTQLTQLIKKYADLNR